MDFSQPQLGQSLSAVSDKSLEEEFEDTIQEIHRRTAATSTDQSDQNQISILRQLLLTERQRNEQRRQNNNALKSYLAKLQADFLRSQKDIVDALEMAQKIKGQKEAQLSVVETNLKHKDQLICQLQSALDESKLRDEFDDLLKKQKKLAEFERDQLKKQIDSLEQQLVGERIANSQTLQQFQEKLEDKTRENDQQADIMRQQIVKLKAEIEDLLNSPENLIVKALKEEKTGLSSQVDDLSETLKECQTKYENLKKSLESLLVEQDELEQKNLEALVKLQEQHTEQRKYQADLKMALHDKEEVIQVLQFNLQRSERRVKNVFGALKGKESTYKELVEEIQSQYDKQLEQKSTQIRLLESKLVEIEQEIDKKRNDIVRMELQHENQLESIRTDRDERLAKLQNERDKLERQCQEVELRLVKATEIGKSEIIQSSESHKVAQESKEECQRLSLEVSRLRTLLKGKQQDLDSLTKDYQKLSQESDTNSLKLDLDEAIKKLSKSEEIIEDLHRDNSKLYLKVKLHESNLSKVSGAIKREHAKMVRDYERRLVQLRTEQNACAQNRIRYRRYGSKLRKYCEHLRKSHSHICNPSICTAERSQKLSKNDEDDDQSSSTSTTTPTTNKLDQQLT